jgi:phosphoserine aminotransferase
MTRVWNFSAGPAALPRDVLRQAQEELLDWHGVGAGIMELSHRGKAFTSVIETAQSDLRELLSIPDNYKVLFLQGGASLQFAQVPMNLAHARRAGYLITGAWSEKAYKEAVRIGAMAHVAASTEENGRFIRLPDPGALEPAGETGTAYLHLCTNESIHGVEVHEDYESKLFVAVSSRLPGIPLVADMSSHILSRPLDVRRYGLIYAGAQKNIGPAGLTLVIVRDDLLGRAPPGTPTLLDYRAQIEHGPMLNTPSTFAIYVAGLVFKWLKAQGGLTAMAIANREKARRLYAAIDDSEGFYRNDVATDCRSNTSVPFTLETPELEAEFVEKSEAAGFIGLKGHKSVGGIRASLFNAVSLEDVEALIGFMRDFAAAKRAATEKNLR